MPKLPPGYRPWYRRPALLVFALAIVARVVVLARLAGTPYFLQQMGDMRFYHLWAERILEGKWTDHQAFYGLPGYAFILAGFYRLAGSSMVARCSLVGFFQVFLEAVTATIIFKLAIEACETERENPAQPLSRSALIAAGAASLAWITFIPAQTFSAILMPTAWVICAYWLGIWRLSRPWATTVWRPWPALGLAIGIVSMLVATITFLIPLAAVRLFLSVARSRPWPERAPRLAAAAALFTGALFVGSSPAWIHNYFIAHDRVLLSAHSGLNFWMGNNPEATGYPKVPPGLRTTQEGLLKDSLTWPVQQTGHPMKRSEISKFWADKANRYISEHPWEWAALMARKVRNFCNAFQYDDLSVMTLLSERGVLWPGLRWGFVAALGLAGLPFALPRNPTARWVTAAVILHMMAILPVFVTERYRLAAAPGLIILGAVGLYRVWRALQKRRWPVPAGFALLFAATFAFTHWPVSDPTLVSLDPFNVGVKELTAAELLPKLPGTPEELDRNRREAANELQLARRHLEQAYAAVKTDPGLTFALGNLWLAKGDRVQADSFYRQTLSLNPKFTAAHNNLGQLALDAKDYAAAEADFLRATQSEPDNVKSYYLLALARQARGNLFGAREALDQALRLSPTRPELLELSNQLPPDPSPKTPDR